MRRRPRLMLRPLPNLRARGAFLDRRVSGRALSARQHRDLQVVPRRVSSEHRVPSVSRYVRHREAPRCPRVRDHRKRRSTILPFPSFGRCRLVNRRFKSRALSPHKPNRPKGLRPPRAPGRRRACPVVPASRRVPVRSAFRVKAIARPLAARSRLFQARPAPRFPVVAPRATALSARSRHQPVASAARVPSRRVRRAPAARR